VIEQRRLRTAQEEQHRILQPPSEAAVDSVSCQARMTVEGKQDPQEARTFRRSTRLAWMWFIIGATDLATVLFLYVMSGPTTIQTVERGEVELDSQARSRLWIYAGIGAASLVAGAIVWRRRRFGIKVDGDGIEDMLKKTGPIPWNTVQDVETHTAENMQILKLSVGGDHPSLVQIDLGQLSKEDQQDLYETVLRFWSKKKQPRIQRDG
jgi:hypothetical protein